MPAGCSFRIERTGPHDGGRPVSTRDRARAPEGERGADKDDAANRRNPAGGRKSGGSAATNNLPGLATAVLANRFWQAAKHMHDLRAKGPKRVLSPWGCRGK